MIELFYMGGPLFMSLLPLELIALIYAGFRMKSWVTEAGLLALATGILGQVIGLYQMFEGIEMMNGNVSPAMIAGGLKMSTITTLYGLLIYAGSLGLRWWHRTANPAS